MSSRALFAAALLLAACQLTGCSAAPDDAALASALDDATQREAVWSMSVPGAIGEVRSAQVVGRRVVALAEHGVAVFDRTNGELVWRHEREHRDDDSTFVAYVVKGRVITVESGWMVPVRVTVLDLNSVTTVTGLRSETGASSIAVSQTAVLTTTCATDRECALTATDPQSGKRMWQRTFPDRLELEAARHGPLPQSPPWFLKVYPMAVPSGETVAVGQAMSDGGEARVLSAATGEYLKPQIAAGRDSRQLAPGGCLLPLEGTVVSAAPTSTLSGSATASGGGPQWGGGTWAVPFALG